VSHTTQNWFDNPSVPHLFFPQVFTNRKTPRVFHPRGLFVLQSDLDLVRNAPEIAHEPEVGRIVEVGFACNILL
jgi:hypothetical protein